MQETQSQPRKTMGQASTNDSCWKPVKRNLFQRCSIGLQISVPDSVQPRRNYMCRFVLTHPVFAQEVEMPKICCLWSLFTGVQGSAAEASAHKYVDAYVDVHVDVYVDVDVHIDVCVYI